MAIPLRNLCVDSACALIQSDATGDSKIAVSLPPAAPSLTHPEFGFFGQSLSPNLKSRHQASPTSTSLELELRFGTTLQSVDCWFGYKDNPEIAKRC